jgi:L-ascorbate metabolism protein UlaG (beta-lactamase superfamily)
MGTLTIEFIGHSSFRFHHASCGWVYLDPWLAGNPACRLTLDDVAEARFVCVSHGHRDHLADAVPICQKTGATLISTPEICAFASRHGVAYEKQSYGLNIGGTYLTPQPSSANEGLGAAIFDFAITMVQAFHTSEIQGPQYSVDRSLEPGSGATGFIFDFAGEHRLYYTGDTGVFGDMKLLAELYRPTIVILPIGGKYTMGPREAAKALELISPPIAIPCHYGTFSNQKVDPDEFVRLVELRSPKTRLMVLRPGEQALF